MSSTPNAKASGELTLGDIKIHRLGFGAMRIVGKGVWGPPESEKDAKETLRKLPELGVSFVDTADAYGPYISESLIAEALHPYKGMLVATKGGLTRTGPDQWIPVGRAEYLRQCVHMSLRRLKVERIDLWQLHRIDPKVPQEEQFGVMADMQKEGLIRHLGLSEVSVEEIEAAQKHFPVVSVQNQYNLVDRKSEKVLDYCEQKNIGFIPWYPMAGGSLAKPGSVLDEIAKKLKASPSQVALAWVLKRSKVMLPIPGTGKPSHVVENVAAADIQLDDADWKTLDDQGKAESSKATKK
jgi:pyridoxine 4-dehydrogenase